MCTGNSELILGVGNLGSVFWSAGEEPNPPEQQELPRDDKSFSNSVHKQARNRLEHWLKKASSAQQDDGKRKIPAVTDTESFSVSVNSLEDCWAKGGKQWWRLLGPIIGSVEDKRPSIDGVWKKKRLLNSRDRWRKLVSMPWKCGPWNCNIQRSC